MDGATFGIHRPTRGSPLRKPRGQSRSTSTRSPRRDPGPRTPARPLGADGHHGWNRRSMTDGRSDEIADRDLVAELRRWQDAGAVWQVISRTRRGVTIGLLRVTAARRSTGSRRTIHGCWISSATGSAARSNSADSRRREAHLVPVTQAADLVGDPVNRYLQANDPNGLWVSEIDPNPRTPQPSASTTALGRTSRRTVSSSKPGARRAAVVRGVRRAGYHAC